MRYTGVSGTRFSQDGIKKYLLRPEVQWSILFVSNIMEMGRKWDEKQKCSQIYGRFFVRGHAVYRQRCSVPGICGRFAGREYGNRQHGGIRRGSTGSGKRTGRRRTDGDVWRKFRYGGAKRG